MEKLRNGRFVENTATVEEFKKAVAEIEAKVNKYGWMNKEVRPYSFKMTVEELVSGWKNFERCTFSSKHVMISEVNGFIDIVEAWEALELEEKVSIRLLNGTVKEVAKSLAEDYIEIGMAELVKVS